MVETITSTAVEPKIVELSFIFLVFLCSLSKASVLHVQGGLSILGLVPNGTRQRLDIMVIELFNKVFGMANESLHPRKILEN